MADKSRSRYDELHDRFDPIKTGKAGTRYERLAAMVLKALHERDVVVHDMSLRGDSTVPHQIDVSLQRDGKTRRMIVECKDFDLREGKVGLDIVRSFRSVLEDTGADEAVILTCVGYTREARIYAKAKGIKLAVLRSFEESDKVGRVQKIILNFHVRGAISLTIDMLAMDQANFDRFNGEMLAAGSGLGIHHDSPVYFVKSGERIQFNEFLTRRANEHGNGKTQGEYAMKLFPDGWQISVADGVPIDFSFADIRYFYANETEVSEITSDRVAELILADFSDTDLVIFDDQLRRHKIQTDGTVS